VIVDPVETERLGGVLLVDQRDGLPVHGAVVALDDKILAGAVADELGLIAGQAELGGERVPVVLPGQPVGTSLQPRLEDVGGVRAAPREIPLAAETREEQLRLVAGEH
jgi:hypothetical protein